MGHGMNDHARVTVTEGEAALHVDRCLAAYVDRCRARIPAFVDRHFTLQAAWTAQQRSLWADLAVGPVNSIWAIPYLTLRKLVTGLDAIGVPLVARLFRRVPSNVRTGYQRHIEAAIASDLLEWDRADMRGLPHGLVRDLARHPAIAYHPALHDPDAAAPLRAVFDGFALARAQVSDLAGAGVTLAASWLAFGTTSLSLASMADRFARGNARSRAASHFFLGKRAGLVFYGVFRPAANPVETALILVLLALVVAAGAIACAVVSDPLRRALGLHQRRLNTLVDNLERELAAFAQKAVKPSLLPPDRALHG